MRRRAGTLAMGAAVALMTVLSACTAPGEDTRPVATGTSASPRPSTSPSGTASTTPSPSATTPAGSSLPGQPAIQPPSDWNTDELIGACKAYWNETGTVADWSSYAPSEPARSGDGSYTVRLTSDTQPTLVCSVGGTPAAPDVTGSRG